MGERELVASPNKVLPLVGGSINLQADRVALDLRALARVAGVCGALELAQVLLVRRRGEVVHHAVGEIKRVTLVAQARQRTTKAATKETVGSLNGPARYEEGPRWADPELPGPLL